jgi:hypothetical protein
MNTQMGSAIFGSTSKDGYATRQDLAIFSSFPHHRVYHRELSGTGSALVNIWRPARSGLARGPTRN